MQPEKAGGEIDHNRNNFVSCVSHGEQTSAYAHEPLGASYLPCPTCMHITSMHAKVVAEERCVLGEAALQHSAVDEPTGAAQRCGEAVFRC